MLSMTNNLRFDLSKFHYIFPGGRSGPGRWPLLLAFREFVMKLVPLLDISNALPPSFLVVDADVNTHVFPACTFPLGAGPRVRSC